MKKIPITFLAFAFLILAASCNKASTESVENKNQKKIDAITAEKFEMLPSFSQFVATVLKDKEVPVKASLNIAKGSLDFSATATDLSVISIDLTSWNSNLAERDERVRGIFFETANAGFATAELRLKPLPADILQALHKDRKFDKAPVLGTLTLHGATQDVAGEVNLTFTENNRLRAVSAKPVVIKLSSWRLTPNLEKLMQACGHDAIADEVSVEFEAEFEAR